jgi:alpha-glucosidase
MTAEGSAAAEWWREAVFYQIYLRSVADGDGDGVGDLAGLLQHLPYLRSLGVDALWLNPFFRSPMADHGYDVADPRDVDPLFGDLALFDEVLAEAHRLGMRVIIDVVPNHSSDQHPWFQSALSAAPGAPERDRYLFRPGRGLGGDEPPNNWLSVFGGPAWTRTTLPDDTLGEWYLHLFAPEQPDFNWDHPEVVADFEATLRFWLDRGVDGFRIDVAHGMAKPAGLPDMPAEDVTGASTFVNRPPRFDNDSVHALHRRTRRLLDQYPGAMAVGEVWVPDPARLRHYARPDELHMLFSFDLVDIAWDADELRHAVETGLESVAGTPAPPCWVLANHDVVRHVTRFGGGLVGERRARAAALLQLALPGAAFLYYGDELGLPSVDLPDELLQDPIWERSNHTIRGRDSSRLPMPWREGAPPFGFSPDGVETWLPLPAAWSALSVEAQERDSGSMLSLYRTAIALRRDHSAFSGPLTWVEALEGCLAFRREGGLLCLLNTTQHPVALPPGEPLLVSVPLLPDGRLPGDAAIWLR